MALHSQTDSLPECPEAATKLWEGYSLVNGATSGASGDLGSSGSCMRRFSKTPFISSSLHGSKWLAARRLGGEGEALEVPLGRTEEYVSRCSVCDVPGSVLALHSQAVEVPQCPTGWFSLWSGYSFLGVSS